MNLDDLINYIPIYNRKKVLHSDIAKDNSLIVEPQNYEYTTKFCVNSTAKDILYLCNGRDSLKDIFYKLIEIYDIKDLNILKEDLLNTIYGLWRIGIINWVKGNHPFKHRFIAKKNDIIFQSIIDYKAFSVLEELYAKKNTYEFIVNPYIDEKKHFIKKYMQKKAFIGYENYFVMKMNDTIICYICGSLNNDFTVTINLLSFNKGYVSIMKNNVKDFLKWIHKWMIEYSNINMLNEVDNPIFNLYKLNIKKFDNFIYRMLDLKYIGTLKKEMNQLDVDVFNI